MVLSYLKGNEEVEAYIQAVERQEQLDRALEQAVKDNSLSVTKALLELGAKPYRLDSTGTFEGDDPLKASDDIFELLVKHLNIENSCDYSISSKYRNADANKLDILIKYGVTRGEGWPHDRDLKYIVDNAISKHLKPQSLDMLFKKILNMPSYEKILGGYYHSSTEKKVGLTHCYQMNLVDFAKQEYAEEMHPDYMDHLFGVVPEFGTNGTCAVSDPWSYC